MNQTLPQPPSRQAIEQRKVEVDALKSRYQRNQTRTTRLILPLTLLALIVAYWVWQAIADRELLTIAGFTVLAVMCVAFMAEGDDQTPNRCLANRLTLNALSVLAGIVGALVSVGLIRFFMGDFYNLGLQSAEGRQAVFLMTIGIGSGVGLLLGLRYWVLRCEEFLEACRRERARLNTLPKDHCLLVRGWLDNPEFDTEQVSIYLRQVADQGRTLVGFEMEQLEDHLRRQQQAKAEAKREAEQSREKAERDAEAEAACRSIYVKPLTGE